VVVLAVAVASAGLDIVDFVAVSVPSPPSLPMDTRLFGDDGVVAVAVVVEVIVVVVVVFLLETSLRILVMHLTRSVEASRREWPTFSLAPLSPASYQNPPLPPPPVVVELVELFLRNRPPLSRTFLMSARTTTVFFLRESASMYFSI